MTKNGYRTSVTPDVSLFCYKPASLASAGTHIPSLGLPNHNSHPNFRDIENQPPQVPDVATPASTVTANVSPVGSQAQRRPKLESHRSLPPRQEPTEASAAPRARRLFLRQTWVVEDNRDYNEDIASNRAVSNQTHHKRDRASEEQVPITPARKYPRETHSKYIKVVYDGEIWTCSVQSIAENDVFARLTHAEAGEEG